MHTSEPIDIKQLRAQQEEAEERVSIAQDHLRSLKARIKVTENKCQHDWKISEKYEVFSSLEHDMNKPIYRGSDIDIDYELRTVERSKKYWVRNCLICGCEQKTDVSTKQTKIVENPVFDRG